MTLIFGFLFATLSSLLITPWMIKLATKYNVVDLPRKRKVHNKPIPRLGGVGIFLAFASITTLICFFRPAILQLFFEEQKYLLIILGGLLAFGIGLFDDFKRMRARHKLFFQVIAAMLAYAGGIRIESIGIPDYYVLDLGGFAPFVSMFWIILVINAINLIDGLDGLAAGISFVASCFLSYISFIGGYSYVALIMAILSGSIFGFLRYNFKPASIFMGDGGSYFLGYMLAIFSVLSLGDSQSTFTILFPMLILSLPIVDVAMATVRRFIHGQPIFSPDKQHFHHMLLERGFSHLNAVLILYGVTILISITALLLMKIHDENSLAILVISGLIAIIGITKLGYFRHYDKSAFIPWICSILDEAGLSRERRSFFHAQIQINKSSTLPEMWHAVEKALQMLEFVNFAVYLCNDDGLRLNRQENKGHDRRKVPALSSTVTLRKAPPDWYWINPELELDEHNRCLFRLEMDMNDEDGIKLGTLLMIKDQRLIPLNHYTLKRIEHLRRSIIKTLGKIQKESAPVPRQEKVIYGTPIDDESFSKEKAYAMPYKTGSSTLDVQVDCLSFRNGLGEYSLEYAPPPIRGPQSASQPVFDESRASVAQLRQESAHHASAPTAQ